MIPPLPFGRGEGRGEGFRRVVYPTVPSVSPLSLQWGLSYGQKWVFASLLKERLTLNLNA